MATSHLDIIFCEVSAQFLCQFLILSCLSFVLLYRSSLYIPYMDSTLLDKYIVITLSHPVLHLFILLMVYFDEKLFLILI